MQVSGRKAASALSGWQHFATRRRIVLLALIATQTYIATRYLLEILPEKGGTTLELAIASLFAILFAWISLGFWTAAVGFALWLLRRDRVRVTSLEDHPAFDDAPLARTAIVMPICNEETHRTFAGLRAIHRSLKDTGFSDNFDFYVLSDTSDPDVWVDEEAAWARWCQDEDDFEHLFYRRRRANIKRKTGNIADFCRRWGSNYRYMVVLDADSVMSGESVVRMVRLMEQRREIGILQTAPLTVGRESLYARIQQFANHVYGPLFSAGLNFWQLGDGYYWGHNAIIRLAPFIRHCGLGRLSGKGPMGGEVLSHDFVEAAFMRRAGWEVWLAYDMGGSYEETPPTLLDELKRDRRWSQGNLQHLRILRTWGLRMVHRMMFLYGIMAYGSSLLWLTLLGLSTAAVFVEGQKPLVYFPDTPSLFPVWRVWHPEWALGLLGSTAVLLFLPKILGLLIILADRERSSLFGGWRGLLPSLLLEVIFSVLLAPVRMLFHSRFVALTLVGRIAAWGTQSRTDVETSWGQAVRYHGTGTVLALLWALSVAWYVPAYLPWLMPIVVALVVAIPVSVFSSRASLGRAARRAGLFLIPAETRPTAEWTAMTVFAKPSCTPAVDDAMRDAPGFVRAVTDPRVNALHLALLPQTQSRSPLRESRLELLREKALREGPMKLTPQEKARLLYDASSVAWLHFQVWKSEDPEIARQWSVPIGT